MNEKTEIPNVRTGMHYTTGNHAAAEGALAAGCIFFGGYPITPSSEIAEHMSIRLPQIDGHFVQFEDEIASIAGLLGASWGGSKSMTATSGPGYSLMVENIGLGMMTETPCVIVNVQRGGPSTGLPTLVGQQDIMQTKWGSHGDYEPIALCPSSVQECFDLIITAFNFSEQYRLPVTFLMDETLGHMSERLIIPAKEKIKIVNR
ncbi:MAG: 2-oxoacid:acceptor oxidoreductase subunit alpha, partial [Candidatus Heimdallarchaeota archaeon]